jgi:hypothetical protein
MRILESLKRFKLRAFDRSDYRAEGGRTVENTDALAASAGRENDPSGQGVRASFPPDYVKSADEGRPRH